MKRLKYSLYFSIFIGFIFHHVKYGQYNAIHIIHHIIVPEADNFIAQRFQIFCSLPIVFLLFQVLRTIQFDDEFLFEADEIWDVLAYRVLPSKVDSHLVVADDRPEFAFSWGEFFSEFDGAGSGFGVASGWARHLSPPSLPNCDQRSAAARNRGRDGCV